MRGKVWLLNVWASWCVACRDEHPLLIEYAQVRSRADLRAQLQRQTRRCARMARRAGRSLHRERRRSRWPCRRSITESTARLKLMSSIKAARFVSNMLARDARRLVGKDPAAGPGIKSPGNIQMTRLRLFRLLLLCLLASVRDGAGAGGRSPSDDPVIEQRLAKLSKELRCLQCQNQTLADSPAGLAADLRREIREQMKAGKSDQGDHCVSHPALRRLHSVSTARHVHDLPALVWSFRLVARPACTCSSATSSNDAI